MPYAKAQMRTAIKQAIAKTKAKIYTVVGQLTLTAWVTAEPVPYEFRMTGVKKVLQVGDQWGKPWDCAWFHFAGEVPPAAAEKKVVLLIDLGGEACLVDQTGTPIQGLTNVHSHFDRSLGAPDKRVVDLTARAKGNETVNLWADASTNDLFGRYTDQGIMQEAAIAICDDSVKALYYDLEFLFELMTVLPEENARRDSILFSLYRAALIIDRLTPAEVSGARNAVAAEIAKRSATPSLFLSALGHSHIDLAWLWPLRETVRKGARTFATALMMLQRDSDYVFGASQPQLYQWIKQFYPLLFERIKPWVREGRWETLGAMWVEADTNLPGGEALVRQILYGKRFFKQEFDQDINLLWLPDSFGFNGALPQMMKKAGLDYFCTIKLSWNLFDRFPHHTFIWQGIDGSCVLAHMPPEGTYNSSAAPRAIQQAEANYLDKGNAEHGLVVFGIGDGGGGPGEAHLEMLQREKSSAGLAPVRQEPATEFFRKLARHADNYRSWQGELYLERHQGTYTTQARIKRFNRKIEIALRDLEFFATLAAWWRGAPYPAAALTTIWHEVLLYQFHDMMAGSAIQRVHQESTARYEILLRQIGLLCTEAIEKVAGMIQTGTALRPVVVWNTTGWERAEWLKIDDRWYRVKVPAMGYAVIDLTFPTALPVAPVAGEQWLENDQLRLNLSEGVLVEIFDKEWQRQALSGIGNRLVVYEDAGDAWDIPIGYADRPPEWMRLRQTVAMVDGPKASIKQTFTWGNSLLEQEVVLVQGSRRVDFHTTVDWQERQKMLRTSFPVAVVSPEATCEIQFGYIKRPTHPNTTWEMAKYEVCAHKWIDLSDTGYGVALLNDCKYGHRVFNDILDLNLLRSPNYPDPTADRGRHEFTYACYPHPGGLVEGKVVQAGYELNIPLTVTPVTPNGAGALPPQYSFITVEPADIIVETVKLAEADSRIIMRLYESAGRANVAAIAIHCPFRHVELVSLTEEDCDQSALEVGAGTISLRFGAFEIHTLRIAP